ncbi:hypothetical protein ODJ79_07540 [Actinoplanes sp. KI2]|uniref:hypothetical protein n=1 Tax=Actinoplanes sp. KI2 TaxID=2983315 RepID=UPI0021D5C504|nr:hypothetical protein [Actinoplanes sp. KI2]MCU7723561.1 hypothetical protein [Actinoplanes sp. KI2]
MSSPSPDIDPSVSPAQPPSWPGGYPAQGPAAPWQPAAGWGQYPAAPVPPRRSNATVWILVAILVVSLLACFGISATGFLVLRHHDLATRTTGGEPEAQPSYPNPTGPPIQKHTGDLAGFVIAAPPGSHAWPHQPINQQLPDYKAAAKTFADSAAVQPMLTGNVFQRGFARRWVDAHGTMVALRIFQFGLTTCADDFAADVKQANESQGWSPASPVPGADGADTQVRPGKEAGRIHSLGVLVKDELVVLVDTVQAPPNDQAKLTDLVTQEYQLLH